MKQIWVKIYLKSLKTLCLLSLFTVIAFFSSTARAQLSIPVLKSLHQVQVVWVGGIMNELVRSPYFAPNLDALASNGYLHQTVIHPATLTSVEENRKILRDQFLKLYEANDRLPLVVIGHSKGGLESLATVIWDLDLIKKGIVQDVITIQSPLRGNSLADEMVNPLLKCVECVASTFYEGPRSVRTINIRVLIEDSIAKLTKPQKKLLSSRVHYVISSKPRDQMSRILYQLSSMTDHENKEFDGFVMKKDMWIPGFGNVLMDLVADHVELLFESHWMIGEVPTEKSKKFTLDLLTRWSNLKNNGNSCRSRVSN